MALDLPTPGRAAHPPEAPTTPASHAAWPDVIDLLADVQPGSRLDAIRRHRSDARENAQSSWLALFEPAAPAAGQVSREERLAVAAFVAGLHGQAQVAYHYAGLLAQQSGELARQIAREVDLGAAGGPYGHYPPGPLSAEDRTGRAYRPDATATQRLGPRLAAALAHAHLLVLHPRDASAVHLQQLLDAGWSETDIVVLSQLVAFLAFQVRVVSGLRALAQAPGPVPTGSHA